MYDVVLTKNSDGTGIHHLFMIMEYIGMTIRDAMKLDLSKHEIKVLMYNTLCALKYIHSANIIHRDIKPDNILVSQDLKVKICDFGLSNTDTVFKKLESQDICQNPTIANSKKTKRSLTPHMCPRWYRPPEIILRYRYDTKIDVWGIGCILYELT